MAKRRCTDEERVFGGKSRRCPMEAFAKIVPPGPGTKGDHFCLDHLAANITAYITEYGEVTVVGVDGSKGGRWKPG